MEFFWGDEDNGPIPSSSSIAPMFNMTVPETRKITQITGHVPPSAVLAEVQARKEINVCKTGPKDIPNQLKRDFVSGKRNAAACLNEVCQLQRWNYTYKETDPIKSFDLYGRPNFALMAIVNGVQYTPGEGRNKKDAKVNAAKNAINEILGQNPDQETRMQSGKKGFDIYGRAVSLHSQATPAPTLPESREYRAIPKAVMPQKTNFLPAPSRSQAMELLKRKTVQPHESVGCLAEQKIKQLLSDNSALLAAAQHGAVAEFLVKKDGIPGEVVAFGTGDLCNEGSDLNTNGLMLFDCHAETIARRAFRRYLLSQIRQWYSGNDQLRNNCIFEKADDSNLLCLKDSVTVHLYLNQQPKGLARSQKKIPEHPLGDELNLTFLQNSGLEQTQVPSDIPIIVSASDVLSMSRRKMLTMSGTDKILKWNICGVQGSLLSLLIEPVCLSSITVGYPDYDNDCRALNLGVNRRLDEILNQYLPDMFIVNHITKIGCYIIKESPNSMVGYLENTAHLSINWSKGDEKVEVVNGNTGQIDKMSPFQTSDSRSQICKSSFYAACMKLNAETENSLLQETENYHTAKQSCQSYQETKRIFFGHLRDNGIGFWISRPKQVDCFKV